MSALPTTVPLGDDLVARALSVPTRAAIYRELRRAGRARSAREMGERVGIHANVARTHLDVLVEAGLVLPGSRHNPLGGRPAKVYAAREQHVHPPDQPPRPVNAGEALGLQTALQLVAGLREHVARASLLAEEQGRRLVTSHGGRASSRPLDAAILFAAEALEPAFPDLRSRRDETGGFVLEGVRDRLALIAEVDTALADALAAGFVRGAVSASGGAATVESVRASVVVRPVGDGMLPAAAASIDARGRSYDRGVVQAMRAASGLRPGAHLEVLTDAAGAPAAYARWADRAGHRIVAVDRIRDINGRPAVRILIRKAAGR
jgi:DNA-binding transcriptional ArsR family regulator/TusA-related sulfurtransferase